MKRAFPCLIFGLVLLGVLLDNPILLLLAILLLVFSPRRLDPAIRFKEWTLRGRR